MDKRILNITAVIILVGTVILFVVSVAAPQLLPPAAYNALVLAGIVLAAVLATLAALNEGTQFIARLLGSGKTQKPLPPRKPLIQKDVATLLRRFSRTAAIAWLNRQATSLDLLNDHRRLLITGPMKIGKSREAVELIRQAVDRELAGLHDGRIWEATEAIKTSVQEEIEALLDGRPALLLIEDLPRLFAEQSSQGLDHAVAAFGRRAGFVIATARADELARDDDLKSWLRQHHFHTIYLQPLTAAESETLLDSTAGYYETEHQVQVAEPARQIFQQHLDGTPELIMIQFARLEQRKVTQLTAGEAEPYARESVVEAWRSARHEIQARRPLARYIFMALDAFYAAGATPREALVLAQAQKLARGVQPARWPWQRRRRWRETLAALAPYRILCQDGVLIFPDPLVEGRLPWRRGFDQLATLLLEERRLQRDKEAYMWACFDLALSAQMRQERAEAITWYGRGLAVQLHIGLFTNRGNTHQAQGNYEAALADYGRAIDLNPEDATAYNNRGNTHKAQGNYEAALADYGRAIDLNPEDATAFYNRGTTHQAQGNYEAALADYGRAIDLNPEDATAYNNRGNTHHEQGNYEAALADYGRAIDLNPEDATAFFNRGNTHQAQGNYEAALADYGRAIDLNPEYATAFFNRGNTHQAQGNYEAALADYGRAIDLNPEDATAYNNRGTTHQAQGNYEAALADYGRAIDLNPEYATAYNNRGTTHQAQGNYEAALADYGRAIDLNPEDATAFFNRGNTHQAQGNYEAALADYGRAIDLNPEYATAYNNRGTTHQAQGNYEAALADYGRAIDLNPEYATAYNNRGNTHQAQGNYEAALADYGRAIDLNPEDATAFFNRGNIYYERGDFEEALADIQQVNKLVPDNAAVLGLLGNILGDLKQVEEAVTVYRQVLVVEPDNPYMHNNLAGTLLQQGNFEDARHHLAERVRLEPETALNAQMQLGIIACVQGESGEAYFQQALANWEKAEAMKLQTPAALLENKAIALLGLGRTTEAIITLKEALTLLTPADTLDLDSYELLAGAPQPPEGLEEMMALIETAIAERTDDT